MNVKELKKFLAELPEECDNVPIYIFNENGNHIEAYSSPSLVWFNEEEGKYVPYDFDYKDKGYTLKAVML